MANVVTSPARGTRDFLPAEMRKRERVMDTVRQVYQRYGFEPLETPSMERLETLLGKYGDEGDQLIFRLLHRGDKLKELVAGGHTQENELADMALRYDLTVPLARVVAEYAAKLPRFFKRYQMQPVWRADRPARGRFREFYQCDVDITGSESLVCDVEVVSAVCEVLDALGFDDYRVRVNHRGLLSGMMEGMGVPAQQEVDAITALDKLDKIGQEGVQKEMHARGIPTSVIGDLLSAVVGVGSVVNSQVSEAVNDVASAVHARVAHATLEAVSERFRLPTDVAVTELRRLFDLARNTPAGKRLQLDPALARGLGYYTGPIFEIAVKDLAGSLGGGGRYDNLIGMFLGRKVPAVGFSLGLERILVVMEERGMFGAMSASAQVMVLLMEEATMGDALGVATALRACGVSTEVFPQVEKLGKQLQYAESRGVKAVAFVGGREKDAGVCAVKIMASAQQHQVPLTNAGAAIMKLLEA